MVDREKVIKGIQECDLNGGLIGNCPYKGILLMLKEQEAEWLDVDDKHDAFDCSRCGAMVGRKCLFCPGCGAKMKNGSRVTWRLVPE